MESLCNIRLHYVSAAALSESSIHGSYTDRRECGEDIRLGTPDSSTLSCLDLSLTLVLNIMSNMYHGLGSVDGLLTTLNLLTQLGKKLFHLMSDPTQGDGVRISGLLYAARVNHHQLISHVLIGMLDMLYCDGIEIFVAF